MAFSAAGLNCIGVGPNKLYIYTTTDVMDSASAMAKTKGFCTDNCPGMAAGDIILVAGSASSLSMIRISAIAATTCTYTAYAALA